MAHVRALQCRECGRTYDIAPHYSCEWCFGPLEVAYDYDAVATSVTRERIAAGPPTLWRYADLLPVGPTDGGLPVGLTPLVRADRLADACVTARRDARQHSVHHHLRERVPRSEVLVGLQPVSYTHLTLPTILLV